MRRSLLMHKAGGAGVAYVGTGVSWNDGSSPIGISQPATTQVGDLLLAITCIYSAFSSPPTPIGWTLLASYPGTQYMQVYARTAVTAGSVTHNFTWSSGSGATGAIAAYRNATVKVTGAFYSQGSNQNPLIAPISGGDANSTYVAMGLRTAAQATFSLGFPGGGYGAIMRNDYTVFVLDAPNVPYLSEGQVYSDSTAPNAYTIPLLLSPA